MARSRPRGRRALQQSARRAQRPAMDAAFGVGDGPRPGGGRSAASHRRRSGEVDILLVGCFQPLPLGHLLSVGGSIAAAGGVALLDELVSDIAMSCDAHRVQAGQCEEHAESGQPDLHATLASDLSPCPARHRGVSHACGAPQASRARQRAPFRSLGRVGRGGYVFGAVVGETKSSAIGSCRVGRGGVRRERMPGHTPQHRRQPRLGLARLFVSL